MTNPAIYLCIPFGILILAALSISKRHSRPVGNPFKQQFRTVPRGCADQHTDEAGCPVVHSEKETGDSRERPATLSPREMWALGRKLKAQIAEKILAGGAADLRREGVAHGGNLRGISLFEQRGHASPVAITDTGCEKSRQDRSASHSLSATQSIGQDGGGLARDSEQGGRSAKSLTSEALGNTVNRLPSSAKSAGHLAVTHAPCNFRVTTSDADPQNARGGPRTAAPAL